MTSWLLILSAVTCVLSGKPEHPACAAALETYQADYVASTYNVSKHMGFYYELAFRDLYPAAPMCDCQHTTKILPDRNGQANTDYYENFNFQCGPPSKPSKHMDVQNVITMNRTAGLATGVYEQTIVKTFGIGIPGFMNSAFKTVTVAFNDTGADQYEWVVEFTCGGLPLLFSGGFVGINLYSRVKSEANLQAMLAAVKSLNLNWTLDSSWGLGFHKVPHGSQCKYGKSDTLLV